MMMQNSKISSLPGTATPINAVPSMLGPRTTLSMGGPIHYPVDNGDHGTGHILNRPQTREVISDPSYENTTYDPEGGDGEQEEYGEEGDYNGNYQYESDLTTPNYRSEKDVLFFAEIIDGYSFRNSVEYLKATNKKGNFVFSRDKIMYAQDNATGTVLNVMVYYGKELPRYIYNSDQEQEVVGMDLGHLRTLTKPIGKKDSVCLFRMKGNNPFFYIQIISQNNRSSNRDNLNMVRPVNVDVKVFEVPPYQRGDIPNCSIPASEFAKTCNAINAVKCTFASIRGYQAGVQIKGITDNGLVGRSDAYGDLSQPIGSPDRRQSPGPRFDLSGLIPRQMKAPQPLGPPRSRGPRLVIQNTSPDNNEIRVSIATIKALAKLNNLSTQGMVKFFIEPDHPIKLTTNVGNYGRLMVYLQEPKQETTTTQPTQTGLGMQGRLTLNVRPN